MKSNQSKADLESKALDTESLLERIADSPCARRNVPPSQSLEDYLRESIKTKPKVADRPSKDRSND